MVCSIIARHVAWSCAAMCHVAVGSVRVPKAAKVPGKWSRHFSCCELLEHVCIVFGMRGKPKLDPKASGISALVGFQD